MSSCNCKDCRRQVVTIDMARPVCLGSASHEKNSGQNAIRAADVATTGIKNTEGEKKKQKIYVGLVSRILLECEYESGSTRDYLREKSPRARPRPCQPNTVPRPRLRFVLCSNDGEKGNNFCLFKRKVVL